MWQNVHDVVIMYIRPIWILLVPEIVKFKTNMHRQTEFISSSLSVIITLKFLKDLCFKRIVIYIANQAKRYGVWSSRRRSNTAERREVLEAVRRGGIWIDGRCPEMFYAWNHWMVACKVIENYKLMACAFCKQWAVSLAGAIASLPGWRSIDNDCGLCPKHLDFKKMMKNLWQRLWLQFHAVCGGQMQRHNVTEELWRR